MYNGRIDLLVELNLFEAIIFPFLFLHIPVDKSVNRRIIIIDTTF